MLNTSHGLKHRRFFVSWNGIWKLFVMLLLSVLVYIYGNAYIRYKNIPKPSSTLSTADNVNTAYSSYASIKDRNKIKLLNSSWIKQFPHLMDMIVNIGNVTQEKMTSAKYTSVIFSKRKIHKIVELFNATIIARDDLGARKKYGGDFFIATLRRSEHKEDGISCGVLDNMDGSYGVTCVPMWSGETRLNIILLHPSESVYEIIMKLSSETEWGAKMKATMMNSRKVKEHTYCSIGYPEKRTDELCDCSNSTHGEKWKCLKPRSGECSDITWMELIKTKKDMKFWGTMYFRMGKNAFVKINSSGSSFKVDSTTNPQHFFKYKNLDAKIWKPAGWIWNSSWIDFEKENPPYSNIRLQRCAENRTFYFIGDSTLRYWFSHFVQVLNITQIPPSDTRLYSRPQDEFSKVYNTSVHYRAHGPPMHNPGPAWVRPYISDTLDSIKVGGEETYVVMTLGLHFELYDADVYAERLKIIKIAVKSLLSRLPNTRFFIKGFHYHDPTPLCPTPWISYRYDVMLRHEFQDIAKVVFLPMWEFSILANNKDIHPQGRIFTRQIGMFLSNIC